MNRLRRAFLTLALLAPVALADAAESEPIHVVKFIDFGCSVCRESELLDPPVRAEVERSGGRFVVAPLPRGRNNARERFYYALRELGPDLEVRVRMSMYRGAQDLGYPLADVPQTLDWLQSELTSDPIDWPRMIEAVEGPEPHAAVDRAVALAVRGGVQVVPAYALVRGSRVITTLDPKSVPNGELSALREAVLNALRQANSAK